MLQLAAVSVAAYSLLVQLVVQEAVAVPPQVVVLQIKETLAHSQDMETMVVQET
jgi:hypothetical protein